MLRSSPPGETLTAEDIAADIEAGAPVDRAGRVDAVGYLAWLLRQHGYGGEAE